ncbi:MAG: glycine--tRNA ligase subunit beta [Rhodocyclaceae bacterium]
MATETLLVELLTEELPPKALKSLADVFARHVAEGLARAGLCAQEVQHELFATPRRLAVLVPGVLAQAPSRKVREKIMPVTVALDAAGNPSPALLKKLAAKGIPADAVARFERAVDGKSETFFYEMDVAGAALDAVLGDIVAEAVKKLPIPKVMRWGDSEHQFVRPVHGLILLHGSRVVPGSVLGLDSGNVTQGHRFLGQPQIAIAHAEHYAAALETQGKVIAGFDARRARIRRDLEAAAAREGARLNDGFEALLDEVTALVEIPAVYVGEFGREFLDVPQECLILTMQQNQKYFPLLDPAGKLLPRFLIVSNMPIDDPANIIAGNQRVVRPRLADARFFYQQDRKQKLESRVGRLANVVYHNKLGSQLQRVERLERLAQIVARRLHADVAQAGRAARLAKADLVTDMVGEFPELQGIMGQYYARHDGEPDAVARAIEQHYRPRFAGDVLPEGNVAAAVALADRLDAMVGFFGIGQVPTGDKDPYGQRRAALGVLRILSESVLPLDLGELIRDTGDGFPAGTLAPEHAVKLHDFMLERLRGYLRDAGYAHEQVDAVLAQRPTRIDLVLPKLAAVREFVELPEAAALAAANKRIVNILRKAEDRFGEPDVALLQEAAERVLFERVNAISPGVRSQLANEDYAGALKALSELRGPVDAFFDGVMVMVDEPLTRQNRLALLNQLAGLMNQVADISRLCL